MFPLSDQQNWQQIMQRELMLFYTLSTGIVTMENNLIWFSFSNQHHHCEQRMTLTGQLNCYLKRKLEQLSLSAPLIIIRGGVTPSPKTGE